MKIHILTLGNLFLIKYNSISNESAASNELTCE
jgi:hypothetical protein